MGASVTFDYAKWAARYPEFASVSQPTIEAYFDEATVYLRNDGGGPCNTDSLQLTLLNMLTAHICALNATVNGVAPSPLVGKITDAAEGSVNVSVESGTYPPGSAQWFQQTKYGAAFWAATTAFRTVRYRSRLRRVFGSGAWWG